jgi:PKD repeat protein
MKKITLSIFLTVGLITSMAAQAPCSANGTLTPTGNPGEFTITDLSTAGNAPYSYFTPGVSGSGNYVGLQPNTTTGTFQYTQNGSYAYGFTIVDSLTGCFDVFWDSIMVTGIGTTPPCQAAFTILQDSTNQGVFWCWNNSIGGTPAAGLSYLWDFGDGSTSTQAYPTHTFSGLGVYTICLTVSEPNSSCTSTTCDSIVVSVKASGTTLNVLPPGASASVDEFSSISNLSVYPNPTEGLFSLEMNALGMHTVEITLHDLRGQLINHTLNDIQIGNNRIELDASELKAGIYLVSVVSNGQKQIIRLVKK